MNTSRMNDFKLCAGFVMAYLYDAFPIPITLDSHSIQRHLEKSGLIVAQTNRSMLENTPGLETALLSHQWAVQFLEDEGLIRNTMREKHRLQYELDPKSVSVFNLTKAGKGDYTLSLNGLSILERTHDKQSDANIHRIHTAIDEQDVQTIIAIMSDLIATQ
ncbi:MAG: hypothetical protein R8K22_07570 [Mariprofundaceae bacterium]